MSESSNASEFLQFQEDHFFEDMTAPQLRTDQRTQKTEQMRERVSGLGNIKISAPTLRPAPVMQMPEESETLSIQRHDALGKAVSLAILFACVGWVAFCVAYAFQQGEAFSFAPNDLGAFLMAMLAPPALLWFFAQRLDQRSLSSQAEMMRAELRESVAQIRQEIPSFSQEDITRLVEQTQEIAQSAATTLSALQSTRTGLHDEAEHVLEVAKNAELHMGRLSGNLTARAQSLELLLENAVATEAQLMSSTQRILDATQEADIKAQDIAERLASAVSEHETSLHEVQSQMAETVETFTAQEAHIEETIQAISTRLNDVGHLLSAPLSDLNSALHGVDTRHKLIEDLLVNRVKELEDVSDKACESAEIIRNKLRGQAQEILSASGQIAGQSRTIEERMQAQKEALSTQTQESIAQIKQVADVLSAQSDALKHVSAHAVDDVQALGAAIAERCNDIDNTADKALSHLGALGRALGERLAEMQGQSEKAEKSIHAVRGELEQTAKAMLPACEGVINVAQRMQDKFSDLHMSYETSTAANLSKLKHIGVIFDNNLQKLEEGSSRAAEVLRETNSELHGATQDLAGAAHAVHEKMHAAAQSLQNQAADVHLLTDQSLLKVGAIRDALNEQLHNFSSTVEHAVTQLSGAGESFLMQADKVEERTVQSMDVFARAGEHVREEVALLNNAATITAEKTQALARDIQGENKALLSCAGETFYEIKAAGDRFSDYAQEMSEKMEATLKVSQACGEQVKLQTVALENSAEQSAERVARSVSLLNAAVNDIGDRTQHVVHKIENAREDLSMESERLMHVSSAALEGARSASDTFSRQSEALFKASQDVAGFIKGLEQKEHRAQRDSFLSSSKFIVESLHSLSVDISRLTEGDISERTWKAFQSGDVSAFTRKLVELGEHWPMSKARDKFRADTEFRTYVQRYIRQFEEMYEKAEDYDHGALLSTTIGSSDVAKLYSFLCDVANKAPKMVKNVG